MAPITQKSKQAYIFKIIRKQPFTLSQRTKRIIREILATEHYKYKHGSIMTRCTNSPAEISSHSNASAKLASTMSAPAQHSPLTTASRCQNDQKIIYLIRPEDEFNNISMPIFTIDQTKRDDDRYELHVFS